MTFLDDNIDEVITRLINEFRAVNPSAADGLVRIRKDIPFLARVAFRLLEEIRQEKGIQHCECCNCFRDWY